MNKNLRTAIPLALLTICMAAPIKADVIENLIFTGTATCDDPFCSSFGSGPITGTYTLDVTTQTILGAWSFSTPFGAVTSALPGAAAGVAHPLGTVNPYFENLNSTPFQFVQLFYPSADTQEIGALATNVYAAPFPGGPTGSDAGHDAGFGGADPDYTVVGTGNPELTLQGGPSSAPVVILATTFGAVTGTIGGNGTEDYYSFFWSGGQFSTTATITGANPGASYAFSFNPVFAGCGNGPILLNSSDSFSYTYVSSPLLSAGQYCIGIDANSANDPTFTLVFNTPIDQTSTPEPSALALLLIGLGMIGARRRKTRHYSGHYSAASLDSRS